MRSLGWILPLLLSSPAAAQLSGDSLLRMAESHQQETKPPGSSLGGDLALGFLDEDLVLSLAIRFNFDREQWGFGVGVPIRLRLLDNGEPSVGGVWRSEDWDEPSDYLKLLRYVYIGQRDKKGPFYVRLGELSGLSVGHGTIVHRYFNGFNANVSRFGVNGAVNIGPYGGEVVIADLARLDDPVLVGGRLTVRPLEIAFGRPAEDEELDAKKAARDASAEEREKERLEPAFSSEFWKRLVAGLSLMADPRAPYSLRTDDVGKVVYDAGTPQVDGQRSLLVFGLDLGLEIVRGPPFKVEPYIDLNVMSRVESGVGLHLGVLLGASLPVLIDDLVVDFRAEYRRVSSDYDGPYFDTIYEIERYHDVGASAGASSSKLRLLVDKKDLPGRNGVFLELIAGLPSWVYLGGEFTDYDGGQNDGTLRLSLHVPALEFVELTAFYYRTNIVDTADLFGLDERSAVVVEARVPVLGFMTINARWWRTWKLAGGVAEPVDDYSIGAGVRFDL